MFSGRGRYSKGFHQDDCVCFFYRNEINGFEFSWRGLGARQLMGCFVSDAQVAGGMKGWLTCDEDTSARHVIQETDLTSTRPIPHRIDNLIPFWHAQQHHMPNRSLQFNFSGAFLFFRFPKLFCIETHPEKDKEKPTENKTRFHLQVCNSAYACVWSPSEASWSYIICRMSYVLFNSCSCNCL